MSLRRSIALLVAIVYGIAVAAAIEMIAVIVSSGPDRPYVARLAGSVALVELGGGVVLGLLAAAILLPLGRAARRGGSSKEGAVSASRTPPGIDPLTARPREAGTPPGGPGPIGAGRERPGSGSRLATPAAERGYPADATDRSAAALAIGLAVALATLFCLANEAIPALARPPDALLTSGAAAVVAGLGAGLARRWLLPPSRSGAALVIEPPLLASAIVGGFAMLRARSVPPGSRKGLVLWALAPLLAQGAAVAIERLRALRGRRIASAWAAGPLLIVLLVVAGSLGARARGRAVCPPLPARAAGPPDVLVIVMDTTRADFAPAPPGARYKTPALESLAAEGARFTSAFSTSCWTLPAHGSLLTGLAPSEHGACWAHASLSTEVTTLAERFTRAGWRTGGFSANAWVIPEFGFDRGFDRFFVGDCDRRPWKPWLTTFFRGLFGRDTARVPAAIPDARAPAASSRSGTIGAPPPTLGSAGSPLRDASPAPSASPAAAPLGAPGVEATVGAPAGPVAVRRRPAPWGLAASLDLFEDKCGLTLVSEALRFLGEKDGRPAFVFINLMEPHLPYAPPRSALGPLEGTGWDEASLARLDQDRLRDLKPGGARTRREIEGLRLLYGAEVAYADQLVSRLLERIEEAGRLEATIVLVTADHGENLGQHPPLDHQLGLYDTLVHVPLVLRYPARVRSGAVVDDLVSLVDVPAALLELAGVPQDAGGSNPPGGGAANPTAEPGGGPILGASQREAVLFEYDRPIHILDLIQHVLKIDPAPWDRSLAGIRTRTAKWIEATDGHPQAFDLAADPEERHDLAVDPSAVPASMGSLAARLRAVLAARIVRHPGEKQPPISEQTAEKLRSLGYIR